MSEGTPKAIEIKGIVRNSTVIGAQDGQAEDLINLRFMDGSWRASGDGRLVHTMSGTQYTQLYVHTNVYHHLLGVNNGTLYWFAEIGTDGTFYPLKSGNSSSEDTFIKTLPDAPVELTTVHGDLWITQTGHLLTVIDGEDDFEHFVFKTSDERYVEVNVNVNGKETDRKLYPFGQIHFNYVTGETDDFIYKDKDDEQYIHLDNDDINRSDSTAIMPGDNESTTHAAAQIWHAQMLKVFNKAAEDNRFTGAFLVVAAIKLYDGSYVYASNPVLINPRELSSMDSELSVQHNARFCYKYDLLLYIKGAPGPSSTVVFRPILGCRKQNVIWEGPATAGPMTIPEENPKTEEIPVFTSGASSAYIQYGNAESWHSMADRTMESIVRGSDLLLSIEDINFLEENKDIFKSICIFVTSQTNLIDLSADAYKNGEVRIFEGWYSRDEVSVEDAEHIYKLNGEEVYSPQFDYTGNTTIGNIHYNPPRRKVQDMVYDLIHSPFYLLREYDIRTIQELRESPVVKLTDPEYKNILLPEILVQQKTLTVEAFSRTTYLPKSMFMYNGRLHIANYKAYPFFCYPIDQFHLHNNSLKEQSGAYYKDVLKNLIGNQIEYLQYPKGEVTIKDAATLGDSGALMNAAAPYFLVKVVLDSEQGEQVVVRYIPAYDPTSAPAHTANFIEDLTPILTYPDSRASKMEIYYVDHYTPSGGLTPQGMVGYYVKRKVFDLKPHPYLNMAYYIDPELKPIKLSEFDSWPLIQEIGG